MKYSLIIQGERPKVHLAKEKMKAMGDNEVKFNLNKSILERHRLIESEAINNDISHGGGGKINIKINIKA